MFDFIPQLVIVIALVAIIIIVARKSLKTADVKGEDLKKKESKEWLLLKKAVRIFIVKVREISLKVFRLLTFRFKKAKEDVKHKATASPEEQDEEELSKLAEEKPTAAEQAPMADADEIVDLIEKASGYYGKGDFEAAEKVYIEIISKDPKNHRAYKGLGKIYKRQRNFKDAEASFKQVLKLEPGDQEAKQELKELEEME